jgi:DNA-3-methyladenine glycosylase I
MAAATSAVLTTKLSALVRNSVSASRVSLISSRFALSWLTILRKRDNFREAFANFEFDRVARFAARDVERLVNNAAIVRHRGKIESTINNARRCLELVEAEGSLSAYVWGFEPTTRRESTEMSETLESRALAKDLKKRGWTFVGPTTVYAFMQAMGLVNDHREGCASREPALAARAAMR